MVVLSNSTDIGHVMYCRSGNFHVRKFLYDKFSC